MQAGPFVSYARKDQAFVRRLHQALEQRQRDTWVDWEGIYPTEEWMARIRSAIDAAPAFVFVISPDSVASTVCGEEIEHAVRQNKRIVPIVSRAVNAASVHPAVAKLNWIQFRESDDFDAQVDALVAAMDLDIEWLRSHTRILVRGEEWLKRNRDGSLLLRGSDLRDAERWLLAADAAAKRVPTPTQTQFIVSSRQAETRRRNVQRTVAGVAAIVLSILSIYSWIQKTTAERQRNLAISRQLAARASSLGADDHSARLLVSALATRYSHSSEADASLAQALLPTVPLTRMLWSLSTADPMECIAFHRGGTYVAGSNTHGVAVWQVATGRMEAFMPSQDGVDCVAFGPRDDLVAVSDEGRVILWEWKQDRQRTLGGEPNGAETRSAFSADGRSVFVASGGQVTKCDAANGTSQVLIPAVAPDATYAFSADGRRFAIADESAKITVWDLDTAKPVIELQGPQAGGTALALSVDGRTLAAGRDKIMVWDLAAGDSQPINELSETPVLSLALSANGETIAAAGPNGAILQWDFRRRRQRTPLQGPRYGTRAIAFSPDDTLVATGGMPGSIWLWTPSKQHSHILQRDADVEILGEESTRDGTMLALKRGRGHILWNASGARSPVDVTGFPERYTAIQLSPGGQVLAVLDGRGTIHLWNAATGQSLRQITVQGTSLERLDLDAAGTLVAGVGIDGDIVVAESGTGKSWSKAADATGHARSVAFSPDGRRVASGGLEGAVHVWDARTGDHLFALQNGETNVLALAFTPDGAGLAATTGSAIALWDLDRRAVRRTLRGHKGAVTSLSFSPDGTLLASGSLDKGAIIWSPVSGEALFRIDDAINPADVIGVAFTGDGRTLATRSRSGSVRLWDMDGGHWTELACSIVNRNLTPEEWDTFLPGESYRPACPGLPAPAEQRASIF